MTYDEELTGLLRGREGFEAAAAAIDVAWAKAQMADLVGVESLEPSDDQLTVLLHRARYAGTYVPEAARFESKAWLRERGFGDDLPEGELPA